MGHYVGLQVPGPQSSPSHHIHQSKVLGFVVAAWDALEAVRHLLKSSDWSIVTIMASDWSPAQCWDLDKDLQEYSNQELAPVFVK